MPSHSIHLSSQLIDYIQHVGFLPLLDSGIAGFSAEEIVDEDCRYTSHSEGGWDWPLWKWKGEIVSEGNCVYGKFFNRKAGFISREWWGDFCNMRRSRHPRPADDSIEAAIVDTLGINGSLITRELRAECGFNGKGMRGKFDSYLTRLEMSTYVVTEDFVYPVDKHNREYGWGWSLLTTPERLYGLEACRRNCSPEESRAKIVSHLHDMLPCADDRQILRMTDW